jgi:hypothetical protein
MKEKVSTTLNYNIWTFGKFKILKTTDTGGTRELQLARNNASYDGGSMK